MKYRILWPLLLVLLLSGCAGGSGEAESLLAPYRTLQSAQLEAELCCHLETERRSFSVCCTWEREQGASTTITAPESLAGLTASVSGQELTVSYEGLSLSAGSLRDIVPANALPWLLRALAEGYLLEAGRESLDGEDCLRLALDNSTPSGGKLLCTVWLRRADALPVYAEFSQDGRLLLSARLLSFTSS